MRPRHGPSRGYSEKGSAQSTRVHYSYIDDMLQYMKLIAQLKLLPTTEQAGALLSTLERANAACTAISAYAWEQRTFGKFDLQKALYHATKGEYGLSAQMVVRCLAKVGDSYKLDRETQRTYRPHGSIAYDDRILSFNMVKQTVSIWTLEGRQTIPFVCGLRQLNMLLTRHGESDLVYRKGQWFLLVTCNADEPTPEDVDAALGVDFGIVNLATDSDGASYSGAKVEQLRIKHQQRRDNLQAVGTRSAKRRLKKNAGKQRRFQANTNHCIAKHLVQKAKGTQRSIALEDLTGIKQRAEKTVRQAQRSRHGNWGFYQLRSFIEYKARLAGVLVELVDPRNTSRRCNECGSIDKCNRKDQSHFCCVACGHTTNADQNAARNIRDRAAVNQPMVADLRV
jgi:putative transposase